MNPLNPYRWLATAAALFALLALLALGYGFWADHIGDVREAKVRAEYTAAALVAEQAARDKETKWQQEIDGVAYDAKKKLDDLEGRLNAANAARNGLRAATDRAANRARANSCATDTGPPTGDPIGVLADVLGRADQRAGELADIAERRGIAGTACEKAYDALK